MNVEKKCHLSVDKILAKKVVDLVDSMTIKTRNYRIIVENLKRNDDNEDALKVRLNHYVNETKPLLDFYQDRGLLTSFDSLKGSAVTFDEIAKFLKS